MCFFLYLATSSEPPLIPNHGLQPGSGKINTSRPCPEQIGEMGEPVRNKFTLPCLTYVGSDIGCGCGFRYDMAGASRKQPNHAGLVAFLMEHCGKEPFVELYGCWGGDEAQDVLDRREIHLLELADKRFHFRMNGYCRVRMSG